MKRFEKLSLSVAVGEDHFTMNRGSFRYRTKLREKRALIRVGTEEIANGYRLKFRDPKDGSEKALLLTKRNGYYKIDYEGEIGALDRFFISFPSSENEHFYGCGETYSEFDLKGQKVRIWVAEHQNTRRITKKLLRQKILGKRPERKLPFSEYESYFVTPTFVSSDRFFLHADTGKYSEFDFREKNRVTLMLEEAPHLTIGHAADFPALSKKLVNLLGHQRTLPDWVYDGVMLAVQGGTETVDQKIKTAKAAGVKVNAIWSQDWCGCRRTGFGYQVMWNWHVDEELYPNLREKIKEWKRDGVRFLGYINPFLALEKDLYQEAAEQGYCVKDKDGKDYLVTITTFPAAMIDFTNPKAYDWYKEIIRKNLIDFGLSGWMADFGEYLPTDCVLYSGEDPAALHNKWPAIWAKLNQETIEESGKPDEIFFFTRAGYTGTIGSSLMMWTGDQHVDWSVDDGLPSVIPATLSLAMSGFGLSHSDVGGYTTIMDMTRSKELLLRWEEMNIYSPIWRSHEGNQPSRNVQFDVDPDALSHLAKCSETHAALKPYLKKLVAENAENGTPVIRPLFYHYDEENAYTETTEYLLGRDLLIAPVLTEGATSRSVYLPDDDEWILATTGAAYSGGTHNVAAPIGAPPVFIRKNGEDAELLRTILEI